MNFDLQKEKQIIRFYRITLTATTEQGRRKFFFQNEKRMNFDFPEEKTDHSVLTKALTATTEQEGQKIFIRIKKE